MEAAPHPWPALGVLLMRDGLVSKEDLESILEEQSDTRQQRISGRRLGEILIERGAVTQTQVAMLVAEQYELPFVDLDVSDIDLRVARLLSEELARRFSAVPISSGPHESLLLAIADPGTVVFSDELRRVLGASARFAVVGPEAIEAAIVFVHERSATLSPPETAEIWDEGLVVELRPSAVEAPARAHAGDEPYFGAQKTAAHLWPPLGALLIREGLVTDAELEAALAQQRLSASRRLGEILVDRGVVNPATVARFVAEQYELPYVELAELEIDTAAALLLSEDIARLFPALPIGLLADGSLQVVIADPTNVLHSDELRRTLDRPLTYVVAAPDAIHAAIASVHARPALVAPSAGEDERVADAAIAGVDTTAAVQLANVPAPVGADPETSEERSRDVPDHAVVAPPLEDTPETSPVADVSPAAAEAVDLVDEAEPEEVAVSSAFPSFTDDLATVLLAETALAGDLAEPVTAELANVPAPVGADPETSEERSSDVPDHAVVAPPLEDTPETSPVADVSPVAAEAVDLVDDAEPEDVVAVSSAFHSFTDDLATVLLAETALAGDLAEPVTAEVVTDDAMEEGPTEPDAALCDSSETVAAPDLVDEEVGPEGTYAADLELVEEWSDAKDGVEAHFDLDATIEHALTLGASSIHFSTQSGELVVRARIDGVLRELATVESVDLASFTDTLERKDEMRVDILPTAQGEKVTILVHEREGAHASLDDLGLAPEAREAVRSALKEPSGVFLACGPARSGATTTAYSVLETLKAPERMLVTIEDPVERLLDGVDQIQVNEDAGLGFARGLRAILRTEPDVVLVGELMNGETGEIAFRAALAGHIVVTTVHATTAAAALQRLSEAGVAPELFAPALTCVLAQRLVRRVCEDCRETYYATEADLAELGQWAVSAGPRLLARGRGCAACEHTGFRGRTGIFEVLPLTDDIRALVATRASAKDVQRAALAAGMRTLREDGIRLCLEGVTTATEVRRVVGIESS